MKDKKISNFKVFCVFAGLGKTTLAKKYDNVIDLDISEFKYIYKTGSDVEFLKATEGRQLNQEYPQNYLKKLKALLKTNKIILVPADEEIRNMLVAEKIDFIFLIPSLHSGEVLSKRYKERGNNPAFVLRALKQLEDWHKKLVEFPYKTIIVDSNCFLEDILKNFKIS